MSSLEEGSVARVLVLYTGGTIGMRRTERGHAPVPGYFAERLRSYPQLHEQGQPVYTTPPSRRGWRIHYELRSYEPLLDSSNLDLGHWARFARDIGDAYDDYDAFVILHGTDTMAYTASALAFMLEGLAKPVILTGAQIPLENLRNDAHDNLLGALGVAGHYRIPEVGLYFHHQLLRGCRAKKVDAADLNAFASPTLPALVEVAIDVNVRTHLLRPPPPPGRGLVVHTELSPNVAALRLYPGIRPSVLRNVLLPPVEGLILETFGAGNGPDQDGELLRVLRDANDRGVVIVNVTQCLRGRVRESVYAAGRALVDVGVVAGADMTAEAALAKLCYLLGRGLTPDEARRWVPVSLRGELSEEGESTPRRTGPPPA
ncbi:MAG: type I asparaginase, partial [Sandaracinaceae bacterium]